MRRASLYRALAGVIVATALAPSLKAQFRFLDDEGVQNVILDLNDVKYVDSSGLSAILLGHQLWNDNCGTFILTNVNNGYVKKLIEIAKLDAFLTIIPTIEESKEYILMAEIERELNGEAEIEDNTVITQ